MIPEDDCRGIPHSRFLSPSRFGVDRAAGIYEPRGRDGRMGMKGREGLDVELVVELNTRRG